MKSLEASRSLFEDRYDPRKLRIFAAGQHERAQQRAGGYRLSVNVRTCLVATGSDVIFQNSQ
jgi:hypothetical protein